jgi:hypothetical protein
MGKAKLCGCLRRVALGTHAEYYSGSAACGAAVATKPDPLPIHSGKRNANGKMCILVKSDHAHEGITNAKEH